MFEDIDPVSLGMVIMLGIIVATGLFVDWFRK